MIDIRYVCFSDRNHNVAFTKVADDRRFHPVRDYLNALPAWDGIKRVDDLFIKRLSADDTNYVKAVTRKTLVAAVARIYHPGTKFDTVLVLDGDQGIGKSTMKRVVGLTGTPASNGLLDLWGEVAIIDQGKRLGKFIGRYREAYFKPGDMNPYTGIVYNYVPLPGAEEAIYDKISDISVSMKSKDYLPDMPECVTVNHPVEMSTAERKLYDEFEAQMVLSLDGQSIDAANAAVLSGRLLEMANGAVYNESHEVVQIHERKLEMLADLVEEAVGQNVLIAYWYKHDRSRIIEYLSKLGYAVRDLKTSDDIADWDAGKIPIALISPASAGHGLNLQHGGHILIWFSLCWSLEMRQQTDARLNRQGQTETVSIHNIICKDTIDEDVLKALEYKDSTQENLIQAVRAHLK